MLEQSNKRNWQNEAQLAVMRDWTPELGMDRSKLWPMFGNLYEAQASLDTSLQISAKMTQAFIPLPTPHTVFSFFHKNMTGTLIP